jgi:uncharacterized protein YkwD
MFLQLQRARLKKKKNKAFILLILLLCPVLLRAETEQEKQLFGYINSERFREGQSPLLWDNELYAVALAHSQDMASAGKTGHKGSDGSEPHDRVRAAGVYASKTGENIARDVNLVSAHTLLMQSVYHRENILEPQYSHGAVAIVKQNQFLYITELFIHRIDDYSLQYARQALVRRFNSYRQEQNLMPLTFSDSLSKAAQAHAEMQEKLDALTPMIAMSSIARGNRGRTVVSMYTATNLLDFPREIGKDLEGDAFRIGIGFKRIQGSICNGGCYLIVLIFG